MKTITWRLVPCIAILALLASAQFWAKSNAEKRWAAEKAIPIHQLRGKVREIRFGKSSEFSDRLLSVYFEVETTNSVVKFRLLDDLTWGLKNMQVASTLKAGDEVKLFYQTEGKYAGKYYWPEWEYGSPSEQ